MIVLRSLLLVLLLVFGAQAAILVQPQPGTGLDLITLTDNPPTFFAAFDIRDTLGLDLFDTLNPANNGTVIITDGDAVGLPVPPSPNQSLYIITPGGLAGLMQFGNPRFAGATSLLLDAAAFPIAAPDPTAAAFFSWAARGLVFGFNLVGRTEDPDIVVSFWRSSTVTAVPEPSSVAVTLSAFLAFGLVRLRGAGRRTRLR